MTRERSSFSIDFDDVRAGGNVNIGDTTNHYYGAAERPAALHVGVPAMPAHFVGREPLVAEIARRLVAGSTLALSADGLPGVGKTTLAVALAYRREVLDHFTDGVLWGGLGLQPNVMEVLASWASALGFDAAAATDSRTRAEMVRSAIGQRRFLLVIDDAWAPVENALLLRCGGPNCAHFLTTRDESVARTFADPHGAVGIDVLEPDDALQLLTTLAPEACAADPDAARQLVAAMGYLPLAIELVGAYLSAAENRYFREMQTAALQTMAEPAERLSQTRIRLGDTGSGTVTLQDTIRLSLQGLPDEAVAAFHALGAFAPKPETFDLEAAKAVTGASVATLSRLLERHLLEKQGDALSLHQTIADVAREGCPAEAVRVHADHYLTRVQEAGGDWRAIEAVYGQVKWSFSHIRGVRLTLELAGALRQYQSLRGLREDGLAWNEIEIETARADGNREREANALNSRGWLYYSLGERDEALDLLQKALSIHRMINNHKGEAVSLNNLGSVFLRMGDFTRALDAFQEALPLFRTTGDREGEATILSNTGQIYHHLGEQVRALDFFQQALSIQRAIGDRQGEAVTLNNVGNVHNLLSESDQALDYLQQALVLLRFVGDRQAEAATLNNIGRVLSARGEYDHVSSYYEEALSIQRAIGDRFGEAVTLNNIGCLYLSSGSNTAALEFFQQALTIRCAVGDRSGEGVTRSNIAEIYLVQGREEAALLELQRAVELKTATRHPDAEYDRRLLNRVEAELVQKSKREGH